MSQIPFTRKLWTVGALAGLGLVGCTRPSQPEAAALSNLAGEAAPNAAVALKQSIDFQQPFGVATTTEVLEGQFLPLPITLAGKKTGPLRAAIEAVWPSIPLTSAQGAPLAPVVRVETAQGSFDIALNPEWAPNHVRNLLALAKVGYYDGLYFERNVRRSAAAEGDVGALEMLVFGCPAGSGEGGIGHLGYFMRSEAQPDFKHGAGTVGFWHEEDPNSACCRLYVTLGPAPALDGNFTVIGQVSAGLETLKRIASRPVRDDKPGTAESEMPAVPTVIRKAFQIESPDVPLN